MRLTSVYPAELPITDRMTALLGSALVEGPSKKDCGSPVDSCSGTAPKLRLKSYFYTPVYIEDETTTDYVVFAEVLAKLNLEF